jgi:tRNA 2-selenouridine synthase
MIEAVQDARADTRAGFDDIIDVRSPDEFAEDHVPGAVNLPVLSNQERAEVGTLYVQQSKFLARRIGAALVARNVADHLLGPLAEKTGGYRPLIYCWRGGQRSGAMATILSQVGWRVGVLAGGYKTYRRAVVEQLYGGASALRVILLTGGTGSGKTALLSKLSSRGVQVLDLEALAAHRGSIFGAVGEAQPTQKMFESRILAHVEALDWSQPIVVEAESSRIGALSVPPLIWGAMTGAPQIELQAPALARARFVAESYRSLVADPLALTTALDQLPRHHSRERRALWRALAFNGQAEALAQSLIEEHYDPAYRRSIAKNPGGIVSRVDLADLSDERLEVAADQAAALVRALSKAGIGEAAWSGQGRGNAEPIEAPPSAVRSEA